MPLPAWSRELVKYGGFGGGVVAAFLLLYVAVMQPMRQDFIDYKNDQRTAEKERFAADKERQMAAAEADRKSLEKMDELADEFSKFRDEFKDWTQRVFVSRDLYDQRRAETDRRIAALESEVQKLRDR